MNTQKSSTAAMESTGHTRCLNFSLRKATRVINRIYDQHLAACGLKAGQFTLLRAIYQLGETTNKQLQSLLVLDQTTVTRNLKPLIREGYIRVSEGSDRRQRNLQLSDSGRQIYQQAEGFWAEAQSQVYQQLGPDLSKQLLGLSDAIVRLE